MAKEKKDTGPPLKTWKLLKEVNDAYNIEINQNVTNGKPVIIGTAMVPPQLVNAFDAVFVAGEWYGSICGFTRDVSLAETAESCGFPHELCSYARMTVGSMIQDKGFLGKYPKPMAVMGTEGYCIVQAKWFEALARYHNVPFTVLDIAPVHSGSQKNWGEEAVRDSVEYVVAQLKDCIEFLEWSLDQKVQEEKMINSIITMHRNEVLWDKLMRLWRQKPSPISIRSLFTFENLIVSLPTSRDATKVLEAIIEELEERVEKGIAAIENEQVRLLWQAQPGWYLLNVLRYFESLGATFVASPYLEMWGATYRFELCKEDTPDWFRERRDPTNLDECLWEIAKEIIALEVWPRLDPGIAMMKKIAIESEADGGVWHAVRACKGVSYGELAEMEDIKRDLGLPGFILEGSPADPRDFSEGPSLRQIRVFVEQAKRVKKRREAKRAKMEKQTST
ncbi:MAG: 2-hydroxyacyl-CoA dehydratase family protein [Desulfatiglans sp.]|jgi:benzoyl-CoA reductase subunit B|nr:2-hydroxyacyl-CoA dehydratase family protein [Desulfatiglans sp.]